MEAVENAFGSEIDFSQLIKIYGGSERDVETKYSPGVRSRSPASPTYPMFRPAMLCGKTWAKRMSMRQFTRLTNAFSKKIENLEHAVSLHFMYYNFCRVHQTLRVTHALEAKVADHVWTINEILDLS